MKIALCDDNMGQLRILEDAVRGCSLWHTKDISIDAFPSGKKLIEAARSGLRYEYIFLDIEMPGLSGFDVYSELQAICDCPVVFVSTHTEFLPEVFTLKPYGFLAKPYNQDTFDRTIKSVITQAANKHFYSFRNEGTEESINIKNILYFYVKNYVLAMVLVGDISVNLPRISLDEVESELGKLGFFRCSRSVLANLWYCSGRNENRLIMRHADANIEISRRRLKAFDRRLIHYKMEADDAF